MKTVIPLVVLLAGCASSPTREPAMLLGAAVAEHRSIPSDFIPHAQLDRPPEVLPRFGDYFEDRVARALRSSGPQTVTAVLLVSEEGRVVDVIVRKAEFAFFADEVRRGAKSFRFRPATHRGQPAKWSVEQRFEFK